MIPTAGSRGDSQVRLLAFAECGTMALLGAAFYELYKRLS